MPLSTRLTDRFELAHPIVLTPMAFAAGGRLAAAVSDAHDCLGRAANGQQTSESGFAEPYGIESQRAGNAPRIERLRLHRRQPS